MGNIRKSDLRDILNETTNDAEVRARIEELADLGNIDEEQRAFVEMITELDHHLAKAAGIKPRKIDPKVDNYYPTRRSPLHYKIGGYTVRINASREYQRVSSVEVQENTHDSTIATFYVVPVGPEKVAEVVARCIDALGAKH